MDAIGMAEGGACPCWTPDNYTDNLMGRMIYKDECSKCFNTPMSEGGLDVCLKTLVGYCRATHSKAQAEKKGRPLVLNIRKVPKADTGLTKVTKLAIGKPGGIDAEADKYETLAEVYCHKCNVKLDTAHEKVKPIVDSIILAQSALEASTVQEWELELKGCEHTLTLDQTGAAKIATKAMAHC